MERLKLIVTKGDVRETSEKRNLSLIEPGLWNELDQNTLDSPSTCVFKDRVGGLRLTWVGFFVDQSAKP